MRVNGLRVDRINVVGGLAKPNENIEDVVLPVGLRPCVPIDYEARPSGSFQPIVVGFTSIMVGFTFIMIVVMVANEAKSGT